MDRYDYIIAGAGCAGLSLLVHLIHSGAHKGKKILLVDRSPKTENDHTWCFWEQGEGMFESIVSKRWEQLVVHFEGFSKELNILPYHYKMIRADDFYSYAFQLIAQEPAISIKYGEIDSIQTTQDHAEITLNGFTISASYIFSSIAITPLVKQPGKHYLLQHFKGWVVESATHRFNPDVATLMDFRVPQTAGSTFVYVLPLTATRAMVEATIFSKTLLPTAAYEVMLKDYLSNYFPDIEYSITAEEYGVIPMTNHDFPVSEGRIIYLGTAGGKTKASTGYTFQPVQLHSAKLAASLLAYGHPYLTEKKSAARFRFYDRILLHLLANNSLPGNQIFKRLFERNSLQSIFRFLDDSTLLTEEIKLTFTLQKIEFIKAAFAEFSNFRRSN